MNKYRRAQIIKDMLNSVRVFEYSQYRKFHNKLYNSCNARTANCYRIFAAIRQEDRCTLDELQSKISVLLPVTLNEIQFNLRN